MVSSMLVHPAPDVLPRQHQPSGFDHGPFKRPLSLNRPSVPSLLPAENLMANPRLEPSMEPSMDMDVSLDRPALAPLDHTIDSPASRPTSLPSPLDHDSGESPDSQSSATSSRSSPTALSPVLSTQPKPKSRRTSISLLYPDTAPRSMWRPQLDAWLKKTHPTKLREIAQIPMPWIHERPTQSHPGSSTSSSSASSSSGHSASSLSSSWPGEPSHSSTSPIRHPTQLASASSYTHKRSHSHSHSHSHQYSYGPLAASQKTAQRRLSHESKSYSRSTSGAQFRYYQGSSTISMPPDDEVDSVAAALVQGLSTRPPSPPQSPRAAHSNHQPPTLEQYTNSLKRRCISCGSDQSPCWRPSWSSSAGQLCNSCGLRYKKTGARCLNSECGRIPAKGEWVAMKTAAVRVDGHVMYNCLACGSEVEVGQRA